MNTTHQFAERALLLQNLLKRITPLRGNPKRYTLKGVITQEERNAIVVGLQQIKDTIAVKRLQ